MKLNKVKTNKAIIVLLVLMLAMSLTFTGCADKDGGASSSSANSVVDCSGRTVELPKNPKRVACLYATAAHMMALLDQQEKIVGCPNGVKNDVLMKMKYPDIVDTATPHQEGSINIEEVMRINTDLALVSSSLAADENEMAKLTDAGVPYVVIDYTSIDELYKAIEVMGKIFGEEDKASAYLKFAKETIDMVEKRLSDVKDEDMPRVYHSVNEATRTDPVGTICDEIINLAKLRDISVEEGLTANGNNIYITIEEIYKWDPDAIIANESSVTEYALSDSKWAGLTAVKNKAVYTLPVGATRWCHPGSMEAHMAVLSLAVTFYPEKFEDFDMEEYVHNYYSKYFGLDLNKRILQNILAGKGMRQSNSPVEQ